MEKTADNKNTASNGSALQSAAAVYAAVKKVIGIIAMVVFHLRKLIMALPVVYYAFKLANYNRVHLPARVGLFLQTNGEFLRMIDRSAAVTYPLVLTLACLAAMMFTRKAMYSWAISIFTLVLPILLLFSNMYPA